MQVLRAPELEQVPGLGETTSGVVAGWLGLVECAESADLSCHQPQADGLKDGSIADEIFKYLK